MKKSDFVRASRKFCKVVPEI